MNDNNFGPLAALIGVWKSDKGSDVAPTPDNSEHIPYHETLTIEAVGDVTNAKKQHLWVIRQHQVAQRKSDNEVFHDQIGYWTWDADQQEVTQSLTIPRAVCLLAGGTASQTNGTVKLNVSSKSGDQHWGIAQTLFMDANAKTTAYTYEVVVDGDTMTYSQSTMLDIYGIEFDHTDGNTLTRVS